MSRYVIGDIHGRFDALQRLATRIELQPSDEVWLVGDLVNMGPRSADVVRWAADQPHLKCVLGNHDLHLLAVTQAGREIRGKDSFQDLLEAPDADDLLHWLRHQNLIWREDGFVLVHAGLLPTWTLSLAESLAREVEATLQSDDSARFLDVMYGNEPRKWSDDLEGDDRLRIAVNAFTRCRVLTHDGALEFDFKGELQDVPDGCQPWWEAFDTQAEKLLFGHWSALGFRELDKGYALDSGAAWERELTAVRLDDGAIFQVPATP